MNKHGAQWTKAYINVPSEKIDKGDYKAHVESIYTSFLGAGELATTDTLFLAKLPAGARVLECKVRCPATGATGIFDIGYQANGVDAADLDGFVAGADPGAAAVYASGAGAALGKKFTVETNVVLTPSEVTASFTGKTIEFWMLIAVV